MTYKLYTDGGARGNPGPAGIGVVLFDTVGNEIAHAEKFLGVKTNNEAEYVGIITGLELAREHNVSDLSCYLDSELVVKQLKGEYRVKQEHLLILFKKVKDIEKQFASVSYAHIPREQNSYADKLVNKAIDEAKTA